MTRLVLLLAPILAVLALPVRPAGAERQPDYILTLGGLDAATVLASAGGAVVAVHQRVSGNRLEETGIERSVRIADSFVGGTGIFQVNQDAGNFTNQANVVAIVVARGESLGQILSISVEQERADNVVVSNDSGAQLSIERSFEGLRGIVGVNQSTGSGNNQLNALVLGIGLVAGGEALVINDNDLEHERGSEELPPPELPECDSIVDSFRGFEGIAQVSQVDGSLNDVRNVLAVSVTALGVQP